jgi:hypothetical protein
MITIFCWDTSSLSEGAASDAGDVAGVTDASPAFGERAM